MWSLNFLGSRQSVAVKHQLRPSQPSSMDNAGLMGGEQISNITQGGMLRNFKTLHPSSD